MIPAEPTAFPDLPLVDGVSFAVGATGIRYRNRDDLLLAVFAPGTAAAGVFTRSHTRSAAVDACRDALQRSGGRAGALVVNAGNANAFTGRAGVAAVEAIRAAAAQALSVPIDSVYTASTGVIGEPLPVERVLQTLHPLCTPPHNASAHDAACAIMTTDTFAKGAVRRAQIDGVAVTLVGIAKGSGMIAPDMATLLSYSFTDAAIAPAALQTMLAAANAQTFNRITVDGDTSTSDSAQLFATGRASHALIEHADDPRARAFWQALDDLMRDLAFQVVIDGEGARKFITIRVTGGANDASAQVIAMTIANSPLVKTAVAGEDANWGRIVAAVGRAGQPADRDRLQIRIGGVLITANGARVPDYDEAPVAEHMRSPRIVIEVDVGIGAGAGEAYTCDLTEGYIQINGAYRS